MIWCGFVDPFAMEVALVFQPQVGKLLLLDMATSNICWRCYKSRCSIRYAIQDVP